MIVEMTEPYIPGFLAFREVNHLLECIKQLETCDTMPQVQCDETVAVIRISVLGQNRRPVLIFIIAHI